MRDVVPRLISLALLLACSDRPGGDAPASADAVRGTLAEELRIDGHAADLVPVRGLLVAPDGSIVVGQPQDHRVVFFSPEGAASGAFGRRGEGPGEFTNLLTMGWLADTLWVFDGSQSRLTFVGPGRELARTRAFASSARLPSEDAGEQQSYSLIMMPAVVLPDASVLANLAHSGTPPESVRDQNVIVRGNSDGRIERIVAHVPHGERRIEVSGGGAPLPFPNYGLTAVAEDGSRIVGAFTTLDGADTDSLTVQLWDADGAVLLNRRLRFTPVPIPPAVADSAHAAISARLPPQLAEIYRRDARAPAVYPPLIGVRIGRDGSLWIETRGGDGRSELHALDPDGQPIGTLTLPPNSRLAAAERGRVWVLEKDDLDVESIVRYAVRWPQGR